MQLWQVLGAGAAGVIPLLLGLSKAGCSYTWLPTCLPISMVYLLSRS